MKKIVIVFMCFVSIIAMCACNKEEKSELELYFIGLKNLYPDGINLDNGWYKMTLTLSQEKDNGETLNVTRTMIGNLDFLMFNNQNYTRGYNAKIIEAYYKETRLEHNSLDPKADYKITNIYTYINRNNAFRSVETILNGEVVDSYTEGSNSYNSELRVECNTDFNYISYFDYDVLGTFSKHREDIYKIINDKHIQIINNSFIDHIYFNENYEIYKHVTLKSSENSYYQISKYNCILILEKCNKYDFEMPTEYDRKMEDNELNIYCFETECIT